MSEYNTYSTIDKSSYSNPNEVKVNHIHLDWIIDFDVKIIKGSCLQSCEVIIDSTETVNLDSRSLSISSVLINKNPVNYKVDEETKALGSKISVTIPSELRSKGTTFDLEFIYSQSTDASAVQWLDKEATAGGKYPYVFTQCQAIHARSLLPCQDAPGTKIPYTAKVTAPEWSTVLMSALSEPSNEKGVFYFKQVIPVSTYLIALAAGNLASREISERSRVWSEPEVVDAALFEFSETEGIIYSHITVSIHNKIYYYIAN
jgi:leukotriene-A4 hydrolase